MGQWLQPKLHLRVAQKQILTPGLVQMVSVLALNRLELREMVTAEMVANPMLEEVTEENLRAEDYTDEAFVKAESEAPSDGENTNPFDEFDVASFFNQYLGTGGTETKGEYEEIERPSYEKFLSSTQDLTDHLSWQLGASPAPDRQRQLAEAIIGNLDENGYLTGTVEEIAASENAQVNEVEEALRLVQEFDPPGVGARSLAECLERQLIVLDPDKSLLTQLAVAIVRDHLKLIQNSQFKEIAKAVGQPLEQVKVAVDVIKKLDPRPGLRYNKTEPRVVEPDVFFRKVGDEWQVFLNDDDMPQLRLSPTYRRLLARDAADRDVRNYVKERFTAAVQLLKNIEQRKHTILRVCQIILRHQKDFFEYGMDHLKPMMIKEVAEEVGVHPSTVSRAVANKYSHSPQGVLELRFFFSESVNGPQGAGVSLLTLKRRVKKMIEEEDTAHPLTDEQIAKKLSEEGIEVTRRTVAKYREDLRIPSTHQRRVKE
ncbi:MAG TPA: RNA polymerase factor sigma-54 [Candidatus Acidoferrales bacterium]|nr:RNA polymerase factor sigma-54 [Candidatus Acidoferrales bacterium]